MIILKVFLGNCSLKIAMNAFLFITYGFICFIFCLSLLLMQAFNKLDLKDMLNEFML
jgi:hypothetical protein